MDLAPLINRDIVTVGPAHTLAEAALRMHQHGVGSAIVVTDDGRPGIITERDLLRAIAEGADTTTVPVETYMTTSAMTATASWDAREAAAAMLHGGFRHLVIVDRGGRVEGVLSIRDLFEEFMEHLSPTETG